MDSTWWSKDTIALVTGANKGLGLQIVRELASRGITTILTSRDERRGREAAETLAREGLAVVYHRLDVCDAGSVEEIARWIAAEYPSGIDILINNAGVMLLLDRDRLEAARTIIGTNYYGLKRTTEAILPLLKRGGRIINMNSKAGDIAFVKNEWRERLQDLRRLTAQEIDRFIAEFLRHVEENRVTAAGWPTFDYVPGDPEAVSSYWVSKIAAAAYTRLLHKQIAQSSREDRQIFVNSMCPGLTATDMTTKVGHSVEIGADTAVWLALIPSAASPSGGFFMLRRDVGFSGMPFYCNGELQIVQNEDKPAMDLEPLPSAEKGEIKEHPLPLQAM
ncbi:hypothetical protein SELMODRAFT_443296 [Selaginella moellendorffii]|uniref:Uncharacterized protein n=1 Tax=Selaginella moellendorffii TaxID=88036 RepID=D8S091_SELML|nr:(+)-neomenthol dehydrogenase [Selaginella moellendorffii]EFJ22441.1 hypothetical protein SELMODRAFT_443296 [Selaginella moellendorffii]|eukprot:XP_002976772.1 (+)-neomenthol dehydrogenase [Selaginella moellendorffii]